MRFRLFSLLAVCGLFVTFTSCIEEGSQDLLVSSESGLTQEDLDAGSDAVAKMRFAYLHEDRSNVVPGELSQHSLSFTAADVENNGRLTGTSDMMVVYLMGYSEDVSGEYVINGNEATSEKGIAYVTYCTNMNFARGTADDDVPSDNGSLIITPGEDNTYSVAYQANVGRFGPAEGVIEGKITTVSDN